ncbi:MAG: hypothetical protein U1F52_20870 [Burkholderiales bacterium]
MKELLSTRWGKIGAALVILGWSPLGVISALSALGLWPDPNPNPVGPALLFTLTFWPAVICLGIAWVRLRRDIR